MSLVYVQSLQGSNKPAFFKKAQPIWFLGGFIGFWALLGFWIFLFE